MTARELAKPVTSASQIGAKDTASEIALRRRIDPKSAMSFSDARCMAFSRAMSSSAGSRIIAVAFRVVESTPAETRMTPDTQNATARIASVAIAIATITN